MLEIQLGSKRVTLPDSLDEMTALELQNFNKYLMKDSQVGSTFVDVDIRIQNTLKFMDKNMKEEAGLELENMRILINNFYNGEMPVCDALASIVRTINGKTYDNYTESGRAEIKTQLQKTKFGKINGIIVEVKKKLTRRLKYFSQKKPKTTT